MKNFIMFLTYLRIIFGPIILMSTIFFEAYWVAFWLFCFSALTDYFDGVLARKLNLVSRLGSILDPIADKVLVVFALIAVVMLANDSNVAIMASLILAREFWVSGLREQSARNKTEDVTKVTFLAKIKTTVQFVAISLYFYSAAANLALIALIANFVLFLAMLLSLKTGLDYTRNTFRS